MADFGKGVPRDCDCPICFQFLVGLIFQCVNGHIICDNCVKSVTTCPQCRTKYNGAPIRVRALENILDRISFPCNYQKIGCTVKLKRADLSSHTNKCEFGGISVGLCEVLRLPCTTKANTRKMQEAIRHLIIDHQITMVENSNRFRLHIEKPNDHKLATFTKGPWNPVILETVDPNTKVIVSVVAVMDFQYLLLELQTMSVRMDPTIAGEKTHLEFTIRAENDVIAKVQEIQDIEHCQSWRCSQMLRFGPQSTYARHFATYGISIECSIRKNIDIGKKHLTPSVLKPITLTRAPDHWSKAVLFVYLFVVIVAVHWNWL